MKKLMILALVSSAFVATPSFAVDSDGIGQFALSAKAATYCVFGQTGNGFTGTFNATGSADHSQGYEGADGAIDFSIQAADDTVKSATATYKINSVVCNTPFTVKIASQNGGLKNPATTSDPDFISLVNYAVDFDIDGTGGTLTNVAGNPNFTILTSNEAKAGVGQVYVGVGTIPSLLLQGTYSDTLTFTMSPTV